MAEVKAEEKHDSYIFWTNKGGVGKTTLCFHTVCTYAALHEADRVIVVDADPQANLSQALLSSLEGTAPEHTYSSGVDAVERMQTTFVPGRDGIAKTIVGYLAMRAGGEGLAAEMDFLTKVRDINPNIPANVFLLCGDIRLSFLEEELREKCRGTVQSFSNPWRKAHSYLKDFVNSARIQMGEHHTVAFFDTNPADIMPTRMALVASKKLIVPVNADDFSKSALRNMFNLLHGLFVDPSDEFSVAHQSKQFYFLAKQYKMPLPKIHMVVNNRNPNSSLLSSGKNIRAFSSLQGEQAQTMFEAYTKASEKNLDIFSLRGTVPTNAAEFSDAITGSMRDMMSCGIVSLHYGLPLWRLKRCSKAIKEDLDKANISQSRLSSLGDLVGNRCRDDGTSRCFMQLLLDEGSRRTQPLSLEWSEFLKKEEQVHARACKQAGFESPTRSGFVADRPDGPAPKRRRIAL